MNVADSEVVASGYEDGRSWAIDNEDEADAVFFTRVPVRENAETKFITG